MVAFINVEQQAYACDFYFNNQEPPIKIPGPMGIEIWQSAAHSEFQSRLKFRNALMFLEEKCYEVSCDGRTYFFHVQLQKGFEIYGKAEQIKRSLM